LADITQPRFGSLLKRVLAVKTADVGRHVGTIIQPTTDISDVYRPESRGDRGEQLQKLGNQISSTTASFGTGELSNPATSGRLFVVKRVTWMGTAPTTTVQPGNVWLSILVSFNPVTAVLSTGAQKDSRFAQSKPTPSFGLNPSTQAVTSFVGAVQNSAYIKLLILGAAQGDLFHQVDNLDISIWPNGFASFRIQGDTLPTAGYSWAVTVEGYERSVDPAEQLPPPP